MNFSILRTCGIILVMLGVYLNLILFAFAVLSLTAGIRFLITKNSIEMRLFIFLLSISAFMVNCGYSIMGFTANTEYAFIPRFCGLFGIDSFLFLELIYLLLDMKVKKILRYIPISFFSIFAFLDLLLHGSKDSFTYIRHDLYTTYEIQNVTHHIFHCTYVVMIAILLFLLALKAYQKASFKRDKKFMLYVIAANYFVLITAIPDLTGNVLFEKCPSFIYCTGFSFIFFMCYYQIKRRASFLPSVENVSKEIFHMIEVPILIFDMNGTLDLCNSSAEHSLKIENDTVNNLRTLFNLTDVESLHIMAKAKRAESGVQKTSIKSTNENCSITYFVKLDFMGDPFCLIVTVLK